MTEQAPIGLAVRPGIKEAVSLAQEVSAWAKKRGVGVCCLGETAELVSDPDVAILPDPAELLLQCDPVITLGGDGTLIGLGRHVGEQSPVMLGVNFGTLGFLTEIAPNELFSTLSRFYEGTPLEIEERSLLSASVHRDEREIFRCQAVNEALVQKGTRDRLLSLDLFVEGDPVMRYRGDGVIIATPTGSTAYSLAAGGSIAFPSLDVSLITPICPHSLTIRPLILPLSLSLAVRVPDYQGEVFLLVDGQESCLIESGDTVSFERSPHKVRFVKSPKQSYFEILQRKLNWGKPNQAGE